MVLPEHSLKRSSSSLLDAPGISDVKRIKRPYHHHHRLQNPVAPALPEPAIVDESCIDDVLNRSIGQYLQECGFDIADPAALDAFRRVTEEYLLQFASYVRQSMLSCRRVQPIPQDFEHALNRQCVPVGDLLPHVKRHPNIEPIPTLLPSPPPEEDSFKILPSLGPLLGDEDDRVQNAYIPKHFPDFPSKHTYRHTPVFTEREQDPRKIRERATEDGRHGEEALRKLARAAFKDNHSGASVRDKKPWGRRAESMDGMFEKTVRALAKKVQKPATIPGSGPMEIDSGAGADARSKPSLNIELPPIINCERDFWRRAPASGSRRSEETKPSSSKDTPDMSRVDSWQSFRPSIRPHIYHKAIVSTVPYSPSRETRKHPPSKQPHDRLAIHHPRLGNSLLRRIARVLHHLHQLALLQLDRTALATLFLEVLGHDVDVVGQGLGGEDGDERGHCDRCVCSMAASFGENLLGEVFEEGLNELLYDLYHGSVDAGVLKPSLGVQVLDDLLDVFTAPTPAVQAMNSEQSLSQDLPPNDQEEYGRQFEGGLVQPQGEHNVLANMYIPPLVNRSHAEPVVEISSKLSAAGKSHLLYYLAAVAILPSVINGVPLHGRESAVVFLDTDGRFDAERLRTVLGGIVKARIKALVENPTKVISADGKSFDCSDEDIKNMLVTCLQHVHVFRPQSSSALLATLQHLDTYLFDLTRHLSSSRPVHAIYLDSANAFFWQDKLQDEIARVGDIGRPAADLERERTQKESFHIADLYSDLVAELKRLQRLFSCGVVFTSTVQGKSAGAQGNSGYQPSGPYDLYTPGPSVPRTPSFRSALPAPWGTFPTLRIVVQRDTVRPFPSTMTAHNAQRGASQRQVVVGRGKFTGWVNGWGREDWPRRVLDGLEEKNGGKFAFRVGQDGVDIG
ncbi:hypothetical protein BO94DRAFT_557006 [Aspergillus sclerotioniger CBS 115572]|uniref:Bromodomain associated domain-containing protein n=1 Tax=Aspergillus sclerotioniger CBS 115572 TaxID=1450535 RepID=A0A317WLH1_9EURO|nr:hypothetical protein BO94DRAFT_557006 [Aspergillus sclerotioniger CBS 115572]PWY86551.1 hypothetical protein BO94DRAFT_557006 [Aspergillus sclerotioniger CBS 115572]